MWLLDDFLFLLQLFLHFFNDFLHWVDLLILKVLFHLVLDFILLLTFLFHQEVWQMKISLFQFKLPHFNLYLNQVVLLAIVHFEQKPLELLFLFYIGLEGLLHFIEDLYVAYVVALYYLYLILLKHYNLDYLHLKVSIFTLSNFLSF